MNDISKSIGYAKWSWNPVTGCNHGCEYCYARRIAERFAPKDGPPLNPRKAVQWARPGERFPYGFAPTFYSHRLEEPAQEKRQSIVFVCDMADLWGSWVTRQVQDAVLDACSGADHHLYLLLTKAPQHYRREMPPQTWAGTTAEGGDPVSVDRLNVLGSIIADGRWLSLEPLLTEPYALALANCEWVVVGSQTGPGAQPPKLSWLAWVVRECEQAGIPIFMKSNLARVWGPDLIRQWPAAMQGYLPAAKEQTT